MCIVSAVSDYYRTGDRWPIQPTPTYPQPYYQPAIPFVITQDPEAMELLRRAVELLDKLDKKIGDTECNDPVKAEFFNALGYEANLEST